MLTPQRHRGLQVCVCFFSLFCWLFFFLFVCPLVCLPWWHQCVARCTWPPLFVDAAAAASVVVATSPLSSFFFFLCNTYIHIYFNGWYCGTGWFNWWKCVFCGCCCSCCVMVEWFPVASFSAQLQLSVLLKLQVLLHPPSLSFCALFGVCVQCVLRMTIVLCVQSLWWSR